MRRLKEEAVKLAQRYRNDVEDNIADLKSQRKDLEFDFEEQDLDEQIEHWEATLGLIDEFLQLATSTKEV